MTEKEKLILEAIEAVHRATLTAILPGGMWAVVLLFLSQVAAVIGLAMLLLW